MNIPADGNGEDVIDDQVAGCGNQQQHASGKHDGLPVHTAGLVCPVDPIVDIRAEPAPFFQGCHLSLQIPAAAEIKGRIQIACLMSAILLGQVRRLRRRCIPVCPGSAYQNLVGRDDRITLPEPTEGKCILLQPSVDVHRQFHLFPQLRRNAQNLQHGSIAGNLVFRLRQPTFLRFAEPPASRLFLRIADFRIELRQGFILPTADIDVIGNILNLRITGHLVILCLSNHLESGVGRSPHLPHGLILQILYQRKADGQHTGKQQTGQGDGQHRHQIPFSGGLQTAIRNPADRRSVLYPNHGESSHLQCG